jgi:hypothetical protein
LRLPRATGTRPVELERGKKLAPWPVARHGRSCVIFLGKKSTPLSFFFLKKYRLLICCERKILFRLKKQAEKDGL